MPTLTLLTRILPLALLLPHISLAQQDAPQCSALSSALAYNASGTTTLPALSVSYLGDPDDGSIRIINVTDQQWQLSTFVQPYTPPGSSSPPDPQSNRTQTVLWLDTGRSDLTRLGRSMRMCHNYMPLQVAANVTWSHEVLRKSVADTGDCRALVSEACLDRLRGQYTAQAGAQRGSLYDRCRRTNNTLPWECGGNGMVEAVSAPNPEFNSTLPSHFAYLQSPGRDALNTTDPLVCDGRNLSSSTALLGPTQDYDLGVNFPIMDIMTFFGTADYGNVQRSDAYRVQIACLVPGQVTEGSKEKASVDSVLARYNSTGGDQTAGAQALALGRGLEVWMVVAWAFAVGFAFAV